MIHSNDYDFSFSGLKTAVLYKVKKDKKEEKKKRYVEEMALEIENAIVDVLLKKTLKAVKNFKAKTIIVGGGVSANKELRKRFKKEFKDINFLIPKNIYSTDNAVMIGITALFKKPKKWEDIKVDANLKIS